MHKCTDYGMFGMCPRPNCGYSHEIGHVNKQEFFVAQISQMHEDDNVVTLQLNQISTQSTFIIGKGQWNRNDVAQGDLVVFQTSTEEYDSKNSSQITFNFGKRQWNRTGTSQGNLVIYQTYKFKGKGDKNIFPRGRVVSALCKKWSPDSVPRIHIAVKESAFTLDPIGTKYFDDAFTIEDCKENHSDCKQIGIHIVVASKPQKVSVDELSFYSNMKTSSKFKRKENSMEKKNYRLTVSVYLHTAKDLVTEPELSVVKVTENYKIFHDCTEYKPLMFPAWLYFERSAYKKIAKTGACRYLSSTPKIWKEYLILEELMATFNSGVRKLIEKPSEFKAHFITTSDQVYQEDISDKVLVPNEFLEDALEIIKGKVKGSYLDVLPLVAAGRISQWMDSPADSLPPSYKLDIEICSNLKKERIIKCTSPMRKITHYLNQQILIRCMINEKSKLYKQTELLGILGIRFRTPKKLLAVIISIDATSFTVNYNDNQNINPEICKIDYGTLCSDNEIATEKSTICLKGIPCEEKYYCNRSIVSCDGKLFENFIKELCGSRDLIKMLQYLKDMKEMKKEQVSTYTSANGGTLITLQLGSELQLQISNDDASDKSGLGLRLLQIGINCHLCLLHLNHPELAFMSNRKDIRDQNLESRIKILTNMTRDEKLNTIQLKNVNIEWYDEYFSGGIFTKTCEILPGDFLCIRKEIISGKNREGDAEYVWNAHGIVVTCIGGDVKFSVCTLSQVEQPSCLSDKEGFCVDVISTKQKNKS